MVVAIATAVATFLLISGKIGWNDSFVIIASAFVGLVSGYIFRFFYSVFWKVPAKLHHEEEVKANKFTWNDVEIKPINSNDYKGKVACFAIVNNKNFDITNASIKVHGMRKEGEFFTALHTPLYFAWVANGESSRKGNVIKAQNNNDPLYILVSNRIVESENALLLATNAEDEINGRVDFPKIEIDKTYVMLVEFEGTIENRKLDVLKKDYVIKTTKDGVFLSE